MFDPYPEFEPLHLEERGPESENQTELILSSDDSNKNGTMLEKKHPQSCITTLTT